MDKKSIIKIISAWLLYVALHFVFKLFPCGFTKFIGCPEETLYTHMKMAFFSYFLINLAHYFYNRTKGLKNSVIAMLLANCIYPYLTFFVWLVIPSVSGMLQPVWAEVIYSNVILVICLFMTVAFENNFAAVKWDKAGKIAVLLLFAVSLMLFTVMTIKKPPVEMFETHGHSGEEH